MFDYKNYFHNIWIKGKHFKKLTAEEQIIYDIMQTHYNYYFHYECANTDDFNYSDNEPNPFIHLALHLTLHKLLNDSNFTFINEALNKLTQNYDRHNAEHIIIEKFISSFKPENISENSRNKKNNDDFYGLDLDKLKKQISDL